LFEAAIFVGSMSMLSSKLIFAKWEKYIEIVSFYIAETNSSLESLPIAIFISVIVFGGRLKQSSYLFVSTFQSLTWSWDAANNKSGFS
jgi:hypothetical protein